MPRAWALFIIHFSFLSALSVTRSRATSPKGRGFEFCEGLYEGNCICRGRRPRKERSDGLAKAKPSVRPEDEDEWRNGLLVGVGALDDP